jgi:hypothetical protein
MNHTGQCDTKPIMQTIQTATQMMRRAQQQAMAESLHDDACKIPGRAVVVVADDDGFGTVEIVSVPGVVQGECGTVEILESAIAHLRPRQIEEKANDSKRLTLPFGMWSSWDGPSSDEGGGSVYLPTVCAETGRPIVVSASVSGGGIEAMRDLALSLLAHELDHALRVDGAQRRDPHEPPAARCFECGREMSP